ncbi:uncharacterized protein LOC126565494 [Anopheles maculipalpis]|uniref:uncharacterized protein LOC126565494 n=1 Tax=Anopheles maculipalpis TaxID=1496333 RepID=UPI002158EEC8|nr:uncharacterized protein LOC126565494 [Anopheles maculipalpis]
MVNAFKLIILCLAAMDGRVTCLETLFEQFEQFSGFEIVDMKLRVRKFNRTMMTLNGTIYIRQPMNNDLVFHTDLFYSRLGNQQFNHYPVKMPTSGFCDFFDHMHNVYEDHIKDIVNVPQLNECPVKVRQAHILDKVFPSSVLPAFCPTGLWKIIISGRLHEEEKLSYHMVLKVYENNYFG